MKSIKTSNMKIKTLFTRNWVSTYTNPTKDKLLYNYIFDKLIPSVMEPFGQVTSIGYVKF